MAEEINLAEIYEKALASDFIVIDCETSGLDWLHDDLWLVGIGSIGWNYVIDEFPPIFWEMLTDLFKTKKIVGHNLKFDLHVLRKAGLSTEVIEASNSEDTMIQSELLDENGKHDLQSLVMQYYKRQREEKPIKKMDREELMLHCLEDIGDTAILYNDLSKEIEELGLHDAYYVEKKLLLLLYDIEERGVLLDYKYLEEYNLLLAKDLVEIQAQFPEGMNLISPKQAGEYLYDSLGLTPLVLTKKGGRSTSKEAFKALGSEKADLIELYRTLAHTKSTFVEPYLEKMDNNFRLHCSYRQLGARTGRLSCADPNLQQVLKDEKVRKIFIGLKNFVCCDYSQMEAIYYGHVTGDPELARIFSHGDDVYSSAASIIFSIPIERVKDPCPLADNGQSYRDFAKGIFLGLMYGMGEKTFKEMTGEEMYSLITSKFPILRRFQADTIKEVQLTGYIRTKLDRFRRLMHHDAYKAVNAQVQGSCRDILVLSMITLPRNIQKRLVLNVHDELDFEDLEDNEIGIVAECMKDFGLRVPLRVKIGMGHDWWEASKNAKIY